MMNFLCLKCVIIALEGVVMKDLDQDKLKKALREGLGVAVGCMILIPLLDLVFSGLVFKTGFSYKVMDHLLYPLGLGFAYGAYTYMTDRS